MRFIESYGQILQPLKAPVNAALSSLIKLIAKFWHLGLLNIARITALVSVVLVLACDVTFELPIAAAANVINFQTKTRICNQIQVLRKCFQKLVQSNITVALFSRPT